MNINFPNQIIQIAQNIQQNHGDLYLVGGAVRDLLLNTNMHDMDFCVTGLSVSDFMKLFPQARMQGKDFPVFILDGYEFALARKEYKIGQSHTDFEIISDKGISIEEDLKRRDITINAMAIHVLSQNLIDPYGGKNDLEMHLLKMTSPAFVEDPLRVYRVARFASTLNFSVESETQIMLSKMKLELQYLSAERIFAEFRKALVSEHPSLFFEILRQSNALEIHFQELSQLIGVEQPIQYHPEGDAYTHTMEVLERTVSYTPHAKTNSDEELTRFCALVHDFGKGSTPKSEWPKHIGHEEAGVPLIHNFCKRLKAPNKFEKAGKLTSLLHMKAGRFNTLKPSTKVKFFETIDASRSITFEGMEIVAKADSKNDAISFSQMAHEVMKIHATDEMKQKSIDHQEKLDYEKLKQLIHQERIAYLKANTI